MKNRQDKKSYTLYTFEDFLQDTFFISSHKNPTNNTAQFWDDFLAGNPANKKEYLAAKQSLTALNKDILPVEETDKLWKQIQISNKQNRKRRFLYAGISTAASMAILISLTFFFNTSEKHPDILTFVEQTQTGIEDYNDTQLILSDEKVITIQEKESVISYESASVTTNTESVSKEELASYNQLITPWGKRSVLTFSDGTTIWVNAGSRVVYPAEFDKSRREIYVDGEVFLEVAKDESRPFLVRTKEMAVQVLGTQFNMTSYEADNFKNVVLVSGSVQVETRQTGKALLEPGQLFTSSEEGEKIMQVDVNKYISWKNGLYLFESEKLGVVFKRLSRYYGVHIHCNEETAHIKCSGKLDLKDNLETILSDLTFLLPVTYQVNGNNYHIESI
ncbi:MAG: FecR domain-containing protein [Tannerellaceae bacterium]|nr:FecR domain-containing protein [Tannerellaceae bacterium]